MTTPSASISAGPSAQTPSLSHRFPGSGDNSGRRRRGSRRTRGPITSEACGACRKARSKCGSERPSCQRCSRLRYTCTYETREGESRVQATKRKLDVYKESSSTYKELFEYLQTLDPYRAKDVFQRIRHGFDAHALLTQIKAGDLTSQLELHPEVRYRYELPYIKQMPGELLLDNPYLDTLIHETASLGLNDRSRRLCWPVSDPSKVIYLRPFHAARFFDPLIDDARPSLWTSICQDDSIMRQLLRKLFLCEFYFMAALQKDYFLEDMISQQGEFCSSLLVNAVLAYACVCDPDLPDRAEYWNPRSLTYKFLAEAKRLWELESWVPRVSTIQAGIVLNGMCNLSGLDEIGQTYREQTISLANRLGLYSGPIKATNDRSKQCAIYTAWALFCWDSLLAFSLQQRPLLRGPPYDPLPSSVTNPDWYGKFWLQYPGCNIPISANFAAFVEHRAHFRVLSAQYCSEAYEVRSAPAMTLDDAYIHRSKLLRWFDSLPVSLRAENVALPAQLQLHMYFHHLLVAIFQPFSHFGTSCQPQPQAIVHEANRYFDTLFRLYYIRHGHQNMDIHIIISLIFSGTRCLEAIQRQPQALDIESLRATLVLCATGLYDQRRNNYLAHALYSAFRGRMRHEEIALLKQVPDLEDDEEALSLQQATRSEWIPTVMKDSMARNRDACEGPVLWRPA